MPTPDTHDQVGIWLSLTELATREGVTKQTISEKVARYEADNLLHPKPGPRRTKLVSLAEFLLAEGKAGDVAKELAAATRDPAPQPAAAALPDAEASGTPAYRDAATRDKQLAADLKELELKKALGEVVPVADLSALASDIAEKIVRVIDRLPSHAQEMAAAVARDGELGARGQYKKDAREIRAAIAEALAGLGNAPVELPQEGEEVSPSCPSNSNTAPPA